MSIKERFRELRHRVEMMIYGEPTPRMFKETYFRNPKMDFLNGIEETATGRQYSEALISSMNVWNYHGSRHELNKYREIT